MGFRICASLGLLFLGVSPQRAAFGAEADALAISQIIQARHLPYGSILDPVFDTATGSRIVSYTRCGDSALWTGFYLAAEAFRYNATHAPDALANARRALAGIQGLVDVTGNDVLARCAAPEDSPYAAAIQGEESHNGIFHAAHGIFWIGNTSRDQYSGVLFGLGAAYDLVDDPAFHASIATLVGRMVQFLLDHDWFIALPDGTLTTSFAGRPDQRLAFLQLARHVNPDRFSTAYDIERVLSAASVTLPIAFDTLSDNSYFKFNLDSINLYALVRLESSSFGEIYRNAYSILRRHTDDHGNAFFNMIDRALNGPDPARDAETNLLLNFWLQRPRRDLHVDNRGKYVSCGDADTACQPIPVPDRVTTDFLWQRSPFQLANFGGETNTIEGAGIDYILPYWMARYYGATAPDSMHIGSAASGGLPLAPDAIASIFGADLAGTTDNAPTQPPPELLGGVSITVKDSAAVSRLAGLYYVSPNQLNFVVPEETAPGIASFTVHRQGTADAVLSAEVVTAAPSLFTADSSGSGVAAATAIRLIAGQQFPVPVFGCAGGACGATPILLGVDTPVYLSLYGTGVRNRSSLANVTCTIGGIAVPVEYAGPQPQYAGLDQVNALLTLGLRGAGETDLVVTVDGRASNAVRVRIQ